MEKLLLLGDEAIAQGFIDAGGSAINSYPGTPSNVTLSAGWEWIGKISLFTLSIGNTIGKLLVVVDNGSLE